MKRRFVWLGLTLLSTSLAGCELLHHGLRSRSAEPKFEPLEESKSSDEDSIAPKGFFKSSRLPGAMSDEGREVEKHLGIN